MNLKNVDTAELQRELQRRAKNAEKLVTKRNRLTAELAELDAELEALGQTPPPMSASSPRRGSGGGRSRAKNDMSLADAIAAAMEVRAEVTPKEAAELVKANGYQTTSKNFGMMVSNALAKDKRFKRISRGLYERVA